MNITNDIKPVTYLKSRAADLLNQINETRRILREIKKTISALYTMPDRGRIVPELKEQGIHTYRESIIAPWRVICRLSDTIVFVLSVIDSRRNVEDILLDRFTI